MYELLMFCVFAGDLHDLGADSYPVRERAQQKLERHSFLTWRLCDVLRPKDLEHARRCRAVVAHHLDFALSLPPLPMALGGCSDAEWQRQAPFGEMSGVSCVGRPEGKGWSLTWCAPEHGSLWAPLVRHYLGQARWSNHPWPSWHLAGEAQWAARLLARDLIRAGVPRPLVRWALSERN